MKDIKDFKYFVEQFADIKIMRFEVPGFENLSLNNKRLIYYLSQAALEGRDILFDQNGRYNLRIRRTMEAIIINYSGDRTTDNFKAFEVYLKRVWFANGIHHHYSMDKFEPGFSRSFFEQALKELSRDQYSLLELDVPDKDDFYLADIIFNEAMFAKRVNQESDADLIMSSANNYYAEDITQDDVEQYYQSKVNSDLDRPISHGLNSQLTKVKGELVERIWCKDGMYGAAIDKIIFWLKKACDVAENSQQEKSIGLLISFYETGDLSTFDAYSIAWLDDVDTHVDFVNGFIETYGDALGIKASWESLVNFKDDKASKRTNVLSSNAQWFEDHSPVDSQFKKKTVKGVSAKVINAAMLGGDCYPATPIGVNLPNADWIRKEHGSKSVTIENITHAYHKANEGNGMIEEFALDAEEVLRHKTFGYITDNLHTDLHECLGHGSGQLCEGVKGDELKAYGATIEEARADLFGLYYMADEKLVELGLLPSKLAFETAYDGYIRNGLITQLTRLNLGDDVQESHMRNRQLIAKWCYEKGLGDQVIVKETKNGKSYFVVKDYLKLRKLFGQLLSEVQRIKSEGDYEAAKVLVESYAVKVDKQLHEEVLHRFRKLNIAPYGGFLNPEYIPVMDGDTIVDVKIDYDTSYVGQMLGYSTNHSWLPNDN